MAKKPREQTKKTKRRSTKIKTTPAIIEPAIMEPVSNDESLVTEPPEITGDEFTSAPITLHYPEAARAARYLWIGVIAVALIIAIMWGWAFKINLTRLSWGSGSEKQLFDKAKNDWDTAFEGQKRLQIQDEINRLRIKNALAEIAARPPAELATTTATVTATPKTFPAAKKK